MDSCGSQWKCSYMYMLKISLGMLLESYMMFVFMQVLKYWGSVYPDSLSTPVFSTVLSLSVSTKGGRWNFSSAVKLRILNGSQGLYPSLFEGFAGYQWCFQWPSQWEVGCMGLPGNMEIVTNWSSSSAVFCLWLFVYSTERDMALQVTWK